MQRPALVLALWIGAACAANRSPMSGPPLPPDPAAVFRFALGEIPAWSLIGNALTAEHEWLPLDVVVEPGVELVHAWLDEQAVQLLPEAGRFRGRLRVANLAPGEHRVLFAADRAARAFAEHRFVRSHPLYILTSTDWDTADTPDESLDRHVELHRLHPELKITHLLGPYTFTDLELEESRVQELVAWCISMRERFGDEIGVHIHPYQHLVEAAGAEFHAEPTGSGTPDPTGYSVNLSVYEEHELIAMLELSRLLFEENGLGSPTSFRAGAWNADGSVMRALAHAGYRVDSSALNTSRLEEWQGRPLYAWVRRHWPLIDDQSQPYYMNRTDPGSALEPRLEVLQLPDNGLLVDYVSAEEMIEVFRLNWPGQALTEPKAVSIGWHPINFGLAYFERIDGALNEFDRHLASRGQGPVVYANLGDMPLVWKW